MADLTPEQVDALAKAGVIKPETAALASKMPDKEENPEPELPAPSEADAKFADKTNEIASKGAVFDPEQHKVVFQSEPAFQKAAEGQALADTAKDKDKAAVDAQSAAQAQMGDSQAALEKVNQYKKLGLTPPPDLVEKAAKLDELKAAQASAQPGQGQNAPQVKLASDVQGSNGAEFPTQRQGVGTLMDNMNQAFEMQKSAAMLGAAAGTKAASEEQAYLNSHLKAEDARIQQEQAREKARREHMDSQMQKLQKVQDDYASMKVDPNRFYSNMGTGQKIASVIGLLLGSFSPDGQNGALQTLQKMSADDLDAQKTNLDKAGNAVAQQRGILSSMREQFGDERAAYAAAQAASMDRLQKQIQLVAAKYKGPQAQAAAMNAVGQLEQQKQQALLGFQQAIIQSQGMMAADDQMRNLVVRVPKEQHGEAIKELGAYQKHQAAMNNIKDAFSVLKDTAGPMARLSPSDRQRRAAAETTIKTNTSEIFGGKSESEFKTIEGWFPGMADNDDSVAKKWKFMQDKFNSQVSFPLLQGYGVIGKRVEMGAPVRGKS